MHHVLFTCSPASANCRALSCLQARCQLRGMRAPLPANPYTLDPSAAQALDLQAVACRTLWLEAADYPCLLGAADLGVCLHTSSSGLDLPMKVACKAQRSAADVLAAHAVHAAPELLYPNKLTCTGGHRALLHTSVRDGRPCERSAERCGRARAQVVDMFGCGLPVCAAEYPCIGELVRDGENGLLFSDAQQLAQHLLLLLEGFPAGRGGRLQQMRSHLEQHPFPGWADAWERSALPLFRDLLDLPAGRD